jgi:hypothetical protein
VLFFKSGGKDSPSSSKTKYEDKFLLKNIFLVETNGVETAVLIE